MAKATFLFVATWIGTIFAAGSVLMALISSGSKTVNEAISTQAAVFVNQFLSAAIVIAILIVLVVLLTGKAIRI